MTRILAPATALLVAAASALAADPPIRLHPDNPRYFQWRGRTTVLVTSAEHYGMVLNPDLDFRKYLETLERDGMNLTRVFAGTYVEPPGAFGIARNTLAPAPGRFLAPWARSDQPGYAGGGNRFDLDRFDPDYFDRLAAFVAEAGRRGVVVELTFFSSIYGEPQWKVNPFHPDNNVNDLDITEFRRVHTLDNGPIQAYQERLVREVVRRLNGFDNLIYEVQNEPWADHSTMGETINPFLLDKPTFPNAVQVPTPEAVAWQGRVASWIRDEESGLPNRHLIAQNVANFRLAIRPEDLAEHAQVVNFHYAYPEAVRWNPGLGPIGCDETGFQGRDDARYRHEAWRFLLAGGASYNNLDYSFTAGREDGTDLEPNGPGGGGPALRGQLKILADFLNGFALERMQPDPALPVVSPGAASTGLSEPGRQYAIYFWGRGPFTGSLHGIPEGRYRVQWVDPVQGPIGDPEVKTHVGLIFPLLSPPFDDAIAVSVTREE
jgi:hypothetical protein